MPPTPSVPSSTGSPSVCVTRATSLRDLARPAVLTSMNVLANPAVLELSVKTPLEVLAASVHPDLLVTPVWHASPRLTRPSAHLPSLAPEGNCAPRASVSAREDSRGKETESAGMWTSAPSARNPLVESTLSARTSLAVLIASVLLATMETPL